MQATISCRYCIALEVMLLFLVINNIASFPLCCLLNNFNGAFKSFDKYQHYFIHLPLIARDKRKVYEGKAKVQIISIRCNTNHECHLPVVAQSDSGSSSSCGVCINEAGWFALGRASLQ